MDLLKLSGAFEAFLRLSGGFSYRPATGLYVGQSDGGFVVSLPRKNGFESVTPGIAGATEIFRWLSKHQNEIEQRMTRGPNTLIGGWCEHSGGLKTWLDLSFHCSDRELAIQIAQSGEQKAYFDITAQAVIYI